MSWGCCCECGADLEFGDYTADDSYYLTCPNGCHAAWDDLCACAEDEE
jgi:hypothetical protein